MNCQFCRSPLPKKARVCLTCGNLTPTDKAGVYQENDRGSGPGVAIAIFLGMVMITSIMLVMAFNTLLAHSKSYLPRAGEDIMVVAISIGTATTSLIIVVIGLIALMPYGKGRHRTARDAITAITNSIGMVVIILIIVVIGIITLLRASKLISMR